MLTAGALTLLLACTPPPQPERATVHFPAHWELRARARPLAAQHAAVSSNSYLASAVGVEVLRRGGNAVDAAVATGFALAVTHPEAGSLGGGGFLVIRLVTDAREPDGPRPDSARVFTLDFRETAPAAARRDMFVRGRGPALSSTLGYHAVAVPGLVAGLTEAHGRYGRLPLSALVAPAIQLAEEGFVVDSLLARSLREFRGRVERSAARDLLIPGGTPLAPGDTLRQLALARTLRRISADGAQAFYRGAIAAEIAADVRRNGGILTVADLANYRAVWREPVSVRYRGHTVVGAPLPSSGLLTAGQALMILEALGPSPQFGSARQLHSLAGAMQLAFVDRARLGDPATTPPEAVSAMRDRERAARLARSIPATRAVQSSELLAERAAGGDGPETTHWSAVDQWGNAVAITSTINNIFGSGSYVAESGIFLSDTMDDFNTQPGAADQWGLVSGEANTIAGGKRPLSSMTPFILLDPDDRLLLVAGARGGPRIITNVLQLIINVVDHRMSVTDAISAPRIHQQALPDQVRYEVGGFASIVLDSLRAMGHNLAPYRPDTLPYMGRAVAIGRANAGWIAVVDPRFGERSAGY